MGDWYGDTPNSWRQECQIWKGDTPAEAKVIFLDRNVPDDSRPPGSAG